LNWNSLQKGLNADVPVEFLSLVSQKALPYQKGGDTTDRFMVSGAGGRSMPGSRILF